MAECNQDTRESKEPVEVSSGSSGSDSGSTEEEERLKRLFIACDRDGDGFIDNQDLRYMCEQLNLEDAVEEIKQQLGVDETGRISFQDFMQCRQRLLNEIEQEKMRVDGTGVWLHADSDHSSGLPPSSQDYDSGARDMSPEPPSLYTLLEKNNPEYLQQVMNTQYGPAVLEITNSLHLTALTSLKSELLDLNNRLQKLSGEKELVDRQLTKYKAENIRQQEVYGDKLEEITCRYEDRITELHSVIAELRKKLDHKQFNVIREEDETEELSDGVKSYSQEGSISVNENLSLNDSLSLNDNLSVNENNANQSIDNSAGPLDWETEMSQVINTFNKALMEKHQQHHAGPVLTSHSPRRHSLDNIPGGATATHQQQQPQHQFQQQPQQQGKVQHSSPQKRTGEYVQLNSGGGCSGLNISQQQSPCSNSNTSSGMYVNQMIGHLPSSCNETSVGQLVSSSSAVVGSGGGVVYSRPVLATAGGGVGGSQQDKIATNTTTQTVYTTPPYSQLRSSSQLSVHSSHTHPAEGEVNSEKNTSHQNPYLMSNISTENQMLKQQIGRLETELHHSHKQNHSIKDERDKLKHKMHDLQSQLRCRESRSPSQSRTGTPTKVPQSPQFNKSGMELDCSPSVPKMAELKKLRTPSSEKQILGVDIMSSLANAKVAEHLVQNLQESSNIQEIIHSASTTHTSISENKVYEFEIEVERLQSKIDHLKAQNELLAIALEESKGHCDRMTVLVGKCESNQTAQHLAVGMGDQLIEALDAMLSLLDSELNMLLANCRAAGLGSTATTDSGMGDESSDEIMDITEKAKLTRRGAEQIAKQLLQRLDRLCGGGGISSGRGSQSQTGVTSPWEDLSSTSRTTSTTSSTGSASDTEFTKTDEQRLKEYINHLRQERTGIKLTVMELESVHIDPETEKPPSLPEGQRLDLENAVLMQELMAMKEEKAELKAQNYLLEKEKAALDLQLCGKESQEQAYIVQIEHLKSEITEWKQKLGHDVKGKNDDGTATPSITLAELKSMGMDSSQIAQDLAEALKREQLLRKRVSELMATLERLSKNSETRHKQSAEFVSDLKKANSALVSAFEKTKKKYQSKLKKMEIQMQETSENYETQIMSLKEGMRETKPNTSDMNNEPTSKT